MQKPILLYQTADTNINVEVTYIDENFWLTQKAIAELFTVDVRTVNEHLQNIFNSEELEKIATNRKIRIVQKEGNRQVSREIDFYNLDAIIAVGYRVNSKQATQFRIWATKTLKEFIIKGFVLNDEMLKNGSSFGKDYFEELLGKIREIRSSERRFYQKITDIYALSADYEKGASETRAFFASVQNKLHWAISGKTAAEIIYTEADAAKLHMGLSTWKDAPDGKIQKADVVIAKNYLSENHIQELNRIVSAYLDLAENNAKRQLLMKMEDWSTFLNNFLQLSNYPILLDNGKISLLEAKIKAESEFDKFRIIQDRDYISDFDREVLKIKKSNK
ncbi:MULTISPECIES: virulence RhuM family protein [Flavobacterium]|uniref:Virulence RhuM family protein n=1 Tax=Flavobacterium cupriresistens TaxID=2893885 RepID=A0ABU4RGF1_9FLAO|nr:MULTISPECIES: virulence RhuM family protein [unclassified Flavobacterium]KLT69676.1 toxin Fic [Flavobacterium sp. ABG]MDX6189586.1 virulence RhuM family protein [Flavobacterium sp. Fl-318]UFH41007.1 virulence RhuM family protein [Flavobacterium sp. F-323]